MGLDPHYWRITFFFLSLGRCLTIKENAEIILLIIYSKESNRCENQVGLEDSTPRFVYSIAVNPLMYKDKVTDRLIKPSVGALRLPRAFPKLHT